MNALRNEFDALSYRTMILLMVITMMPASFISYVMRGIKNTPNPMIAAELAGLLGFAFLKHEEREHENR